MYNNNSQAPTRRSAAVCTETDRHAYNAAFDELGLQWHWDAATYERLLGHGKDGVRRYLETERPHLLRAYEAEFLIAAVEAAKARRLASVSAMSRPAAPKATTAALGAEVTQ